MNVVDTLVKTSDGICKAAAYFNKMMDPETATDIKKLATELCDVMPALAKAVVTLNIVTDNRSGVYRWDTCFEMGQNSAGTHIANLDGIMAPQHLLVDLKDEAWGLLEAIRAWLVNKCESINYDVEKACGKWQEAGGEVFKHPRVVRDIIGNPLYKELGTLKIIASEMSLLLKALRKKANFAFPVQLALKVKANADLAHDTVVIT